MSETFTPANPLEEQLLAAQEGHLSAEAFMQTLLGAQLFMPIHESRNTGGLQTSQTATPLTLQDENGQHVVVLFTSPERAKGFVVDYAGYQGGLLAEFTWILEKLGQGHGISINPDCAAGIDMAPEMLATLRQQTSAGPGKQTPSPD